MNEACLSALDQKSRALALAGWRVRFDVAQVPHRPISTHLFLSDQSCAGVCTTWPSCQVIHLIVSVEQERR